MWKKRADLPLFIATLVLCLGTGGGEASASSAVDPSHAVPSAEGTFDGEAANRLGIDGTPFQRFAVGSGDFLRVASSAYDRAQVSPLVSVLGGLPHGPELSKLKLYVATDAEVAATCGAGTMACYDPGSERMVVSGESEEIAGIPREAVIAHEYGHHIANNRSGGGVWPALSAGTPRWSTQERVCELARDGQVFPGDQGLHYWENPGEAFAQSYSQMVMPQAAWHYSPLLQPDEAALTKLRMDIVRPWPGARTTVWRQGAPGARSGQLAVGAGVAIDGEETAAPVRRRVAVPVDGRARVRLRTGDGGRYALTLIDPVTGTTLASARPDANGRVTSLNYAACGQRSLVVEATPLGQPSAFEAKIVTP